MCLGVVGDAQGQFQIHWVVDIGVAVTVQVLDDRDLGLTADSLDQSHRLGAVCPHRTWRHVGRAQQGVCAGGAYHGCEDTAHHGAAHPAQCAGAGAGIADIFYGEDGEENFIYKLAKEIADELDMGAEEITDPVSAITSLFAEDGRKMRELIVSVGEKLDRKVKSGELDVERLRTDAMAMKAKLEKAVPGLQNLIPGMKDGEGPSGLIKLAYDSLDAEAKERWNTIPDILQRPMDAWTPEERQTVDDFCLAQVKQENTGTAEENLPEEEEVKAPLRPSRGAGKGRGKRRAAK